MIADDMDKVDINKLEGLGAHLKLGVKYFDRKEYEKALEVFTRVLEIDGKEKLARFKIGEIKYRMGYKEEAIEELGKAMELDRENEQIYLLLGILYNKKGVHEEALVELERALEKSKGDKGFESDICNELASAYFRLEKYDLAVKEAKKAIELNENNKNAYKLLVIIYIELANMYISQNKYNEAIEELKKALNLDNQNTNIYTLLGVSYRYKMQFDEALGMFEKALVLKNDDKQIEKKIHEEKARIYFEKCEFDLVIAELKKAIAIDPDNINMHIHSFLFVTYKIKEMHAEALEKLSEMLELSNGDKDFWEYIFDKKRGKEKIYAEIIKLIEHANLSGCHDRAMDVVKKVLKLDFKYNAMILNSLNNELEIAQGATKLNSKVRSLVINLTNQCNLNCKMCYMKKKPKEEISKKTEQEIISLFPYLERITWMGGEVFLYPRFNELLDIAIQYSIKQDIATNGLLIDAKIASKLIKNDVMLMFSIDGATKEVYESIRKGAQYEVLIEKLDMINKLRQEINPDYKLDMHIVLMKSNCHEIERFVEFAREHGLNSIVFEMLICHDKSLRDEDIFVFNKDDVLLKDIRKTMDKAAIRSKNYGIDFKNHIKYETLINKGETYHELFPADNSSCSEEKLKSKEIGKHNCFTPWKRLQICMNGDVKPIIHPLCSNVVGNLNESTMEEIWNGKKMINYRKKIASGCIEEVCTLRQVYNEIPFELLR